MVEVTFQPLDEVSVIRAGVVPKPLLTAACREEAQTEHVEHHIQTPNSVIITMLHKQATPQGMMGNKNSKPEMQAITDAHGRKQTVKHTDWHKTDN